MEAKTDKKSSSMIWWTVVLVAALVALGAYRHRVITGEQPGGGPQNQPANTQSASPPSAAHHMVPVRRVVQEGDMTMSTAEWTTNLVLKPWQKLDWDIYGEFEPDSKGRNALLNSTNDPPDVTYDLKLGQEVNIDSKDIPYPRFILVGKVLRGMPLLRYMITETDMVDVAASSL